ncbi:hypothetical protein [Trinickia acidisoli]|uniref:hypothetical protein n=1 Tax=Trinickia acidisoli TaxID=2767482 RepID=UPI001A904DED|nr:hypothetical protein [Trinickia acidisoli]
MTLDNELIVFSAKHQQYFGIEGAGRSVWDVLDWKCPPMSESEIVELIVGEQRASDDAAALIREAIHLLLDLGVLREA